MQVLWGMSWIPSKLDMDTIYQYWEGLRRPLDWNLGADFRASHQVVKLPRPKRRWHGKQCYQSLENFWNEVLCQHWFPPQSNVDTSSRYAFHFSLVPPGPILTFPRSSQSQLSRPTNAQAMQQVHDRDILGCKVLPLQSLPLRLSLYAAKLTALFSVYSPASFRVPRFQIHGWEGPM